jgi:hypothetical protein
VSEIRSWAVGVLAVLAIAVGAGAGVQIARTSDVPVAPVVAAVPAVTAPPRSAPPAPVAPPTTTTPTPSATTQATTNRATTTRATTSRTTRVPRSTTVRERSVVDGDGPVINGQSAAQAYRGCVAATNSPGPLACRALVDAGVRGE